MLSLFVGKQRPKSRNLLFKRTTGPTEHPPHRFDDVVRVDFGHAPAIEIALNRQEMLPVLRAPGGANEMLKRNLAMLGLLEMSQIFVGDFRSFPPVASGVLFCDTLHDEHEIRVNAPALRPWLTEGSILACHDVGNSKPLIDLLRTQIPLGHGVSVDLLYITEVL